jgi:hypothetical protein
MAPRDKPASGSSMSMAEGTRAGCIHSCRQFRPGHKKKKANSIEKKGQARPGQARHAVKLAMTLHCRKDRKG